MSSVFAVGRYGTILHYNSSQWNPIDTDTSGQPVEGWTYWNSVTDLKFKLDAGGNRNIYAATLGHGIYLSPNQAETWINLLAPPYKIHALEVGSIYVASYGVYAFQGVGFVAGEVKDELTLVGIDHARVSTDAGFWTSTNRDGVYVLPLLAGNYNITGDADGYKPETAHNVPSIVDGNVVNFYLTDPVVYVRINGADVLAANGTNIPHGELSEFTFSNLQGAQTIEVLFEEAVSACAGDLDTDGDVDGLDIGRYISGQQNGVSVAELAAGFGRTDCLP
jgi:hypothetical protein